MTADTPSGAWRPTVAGNRYALATGHPLASAAAMRVLDAGGNAVDAGVTAAMALAVLQPDVVSFAGVAPTLIYLSAEKKVISLAGLGPFPAATNVERMIAEGGDCVPEGILRHIVPAAPATHIEALRRFGTISFERAATPAFELARDGYYLYPELRDMIESHAADIDRYPENASVFRPGGRTPRVGARLRQENLSRTIGRMIEAERKAPGDRSAKLRAAHDCFYRGPIADDIARFHAKHDGFLRKSDLEEFEVPVEASISCEYRGFEVHACGVWCQGIVLLETLKLLEGVDLSRLGHNSAQYLHVIAQALNLAFADREGYVGDPKFVTVPTAQLLSSAYAAQQRTRLDSRHAQRGMPEPGDLHGIAKPNRTALLKGSGKVPVAPDTIHVSVVDASGNAYSATPSDTMYDNPMVEGLGLTISSRGMQGRLQPQHPCSVAPGKRPRLTPTPSLALREGRLALSWGTPGGDVQPAAMLQVFLNIMQFGMPLQQAIEAPRVAPFNFPNSFAPHVYLPGRLCVESRIGSEAVTALGRLGYDIEMWPAASWSAGAVCAVMRDFETGLLHAGADPRRAAYALAW